MVVKVGTASVGNQVGNELVVQDGEVLGALRVGGAANYAQFNGTTGELSFNGNARHAKKILLTAEYAGAVIDAGTGANNLGSLTSSVDLTNRKNFYKWTTTQVTSQSYDVVVQVPIPSDYSAWASTTPITVDVLANDTDPNPATPKRPQGPHTPRHEVPPPGLRVCQEACFSMYRFTQSRYVYRIDGTQSVERVATTTRSHPHAEPTTTFRIDHRRTLHASADGRSGPGDHLWRHGHELRGGEHGGPQRQDQAAGIGHGDLQPHRLRRS